MRPTKIELTSDRCKKPRMARELSESTKKLYETCMRTLNDRTKYPHIDLTNPDTIIESLRAGSATVKPKTDGTIKNFLCAARNEAPNPLIASRYTLRIKQLSEKLAKEAERQRSSETEVAKMMSWPDIVNAVEKIQEDPSVNAENKLLLLFYTQLPPVRADYANLTIYKRKPKTATGNYIVLSKKSGRVVLQEHKTAKTYGAIENKLPATLVKAVQDYLVSHPVSKLFETTEQNLSDMVIRTMKKQTGKNVGINIFRHSFISHLRKDEISLVKKKSVAEAMGHGVAMQELYRRID